MEGEKGREGRRGEGEGRARVGKEDCERREGKLVVAIQCSLVSLTVPVSKNLETQALFTHVHASSGSV